MRRLASPFRFYPLAVLLLAMVAVTAASTPASPVTTWWNQAYGTHPTQKVDVRVPASATNANPVGVVAWLHGDGWGNGTKTMQAGAYQLKLPAFRNIALASCDYRGETTAVFPAGLQDAENCVRYVKANADRFHIDSTQVGIWGGSHGAFLVDWMLVLCGDTAYLAGTVGICPQVTVSLFGASDIVRYTADLMGNIAGNGCAPPDSATSVIPSDTAEQRYASSLYRVRAGLAPSWHLHGRSDCKTPWQGSSRLDSALRLYGNTSVGITYNGFTHGGAQWQHDSVVKLQLAFFQQVLK